MKKPLLSIVTLSLLVASTSSFAAQIAPSPLIGPEFSEGKGQARVEAVYINYENVYGGGVQAAKRFALSDTFALMPSLGVYNLSGDHSYTSNTGSVDKIDMDLTYLSGGLRAEVQKKFDPVNFILFGGALFHYGETEDTTTSNTYGTSKTDMTDTGIGWEAGVQAAIKTGSVMTTLFYKYDEMRVDSDTENDPNNAVVADKNQKFTFKNSTFGIDLLFPNGISLSALYGMLDQPQGEDGQDVDITIIKLGYSF
jgi:hypothetical protein